jgi:acetyltransferase-like isoleucine patch superfamily enzyme
LRASGLNIGEGSLVLGPLHVCGGGDWRELFRIGSRTFVTGPLHVDLAAAVHIGDFVDVGHDVLLTTVNHVIGVAVRRAGRHRYEPITVGNGAWIASRVTVLPGVTIGAGAGVAAGAVVAHDVAPNTLVGGVPAKLIRTLR